MTRYVERLSFITLCLKKNNSPLRMAQTRIQHVNMSLHCEGLYMLHGKALF
jgi:hypothetical protein